MCDYDISIRVSKYVPVKKNNWEKQHISGLIPFYNIFYTKLSRICVIRISILLLSTIFLLEFGTGPTVRYFLFHFVTTYQHVFSRNLPPPIMGNWKLLHIFLFSIWKLTKKISRTTKQCFHINSHQVLNLSW